MNTKHGVAACLSAVTFTISGLAAAATPTWGPAGQFFSNGALPTVANANITVELNEGAQTGSLIYFEELTQYDTGFAPSVAGDGLGNFLEIHTQDPGSSNLWFHFGPTSGSFVNFGGATQNDHGANPVVSAWGTAASPGFPAGGGVLQVHQQQASSGPLWMNLAAVTFQSSTSNVWSNVSWLGAQQYDTGMYPTVATDGTNVVEVHQAQTGLSPLWYRVGTLTRNGSSWSVSWVGGGAHLLSIGGATISGVHPSITLCKNRIVLVVSETSQGELWSYTGTFSGGLFPTFSWDTNTAQHYDNGFLPVVTCNANGSGNEVHQASSTGTGALWAHTLTM